MIDRRFTVLATGDTANQPLALQLFEDIFTPLTATGNVAEANPSELPLELRQAAARYPATLYVVADC